MLYRIVTMLLIATFLAGCIGMRPTPSKLQTGGHLHINLGGIKRNMANNPPAVAEVTATITDSSGATYNLQKQAAYKVFPDYTSKYAMKSLNKNDSEYQAQVLPYDGAYWLTVRLLNGSNVPLPLQPGPATIKISSPKLLQKQLYYAGANYEGDYQNIPIDILPGVATPISFDPDLLQFSEYESKAHKKIWPSDMSLVNGVYGLQGRLICTMNSVPSRVVPVSHDPNITVMQTFTPIGDGTYQLDFSLLNPMGFMPYSDAGWQAGMSQPEDLVVAVVSPTTNARVFCNVMDAENSYYIDAEGNKITAVTPVLQ